MTSEDGTKTLRVRTNVSGKESALPLPPLMDPIAMAAKQKYRPSKPYRPRPNLEKMTKFQQALAVNPYGKSKGKSPKIQVSDAVQQLKL